MLTCIARLDGYSCITYTAQAARPILSRTALSISTSCVEAVLSHSTYLLRRHSDKGPVRTHHPPSHHCPFLQKHSETNFFTEKSRLEATWLGVITSAEGLFSHVVALRISQARMNISLKRSWVTMHAA